MRVEEDATVRLRRSLAVAAALLGESVAFSLALLVVVRSLGDTVPSWWPIIVIVGAVYLVVGAVPVPRVRHPLLVGASSFLAPLVILGWVGWRTDLAFLLEHIRAWEGLPRVILAPANLGTALFLSSCALVGSALTRRIRGRASRGIGAGEGHPGA
jgi:hypothetical protein